MAIVENAASLRRPLPIPYFSLFDSDTTEPLDAYELATRPIVDASAISIPIFESTIDQLYSPQAAMEKFIRGLGDDVKDALKDFAEKIGEQFVSGSREKEISPPSSSDKSEAIIEIEEWLSHWKSESAGSETWNNLGPYIDAMETREPLKDEKDSATTMVRGAAESAYFSLYRTDQEKIIFSERDMFSLPGVVVDGRELSLEQPDSPYDPRKPHAASSPRRNRKTLVGVRRFSESPTEMMLASGPDWMSNAFDCFFVFVPKEDYKPRGGFDDFDSARIPAWATPYERQVLSHKGFAVRVGRVSVPYSYNDSYSVPFLESQVEKIRSTKVVKMESSFSLRLDDNLVWLDHVQALAGRYGVLDDYVAATSSNSPNAFVASFEAGDSNLDRDSYRKLFKTIAASWSASPIGRNRVEKNAIKSFELCLVVKMQRLHGLTNSLAQEAVLPYFVFENIKVLGVQGDVEYSTEPGQQEATVPFIFRRCYQILPSFKTIGYDGSAPAVPSWSRTTNSPSPSRYEISSSGDRRQRTRLPEYFSELYSLPWLAGGIDDDAKITGKTP